MKMRTVLAITLGALLLFQGWRKLPVASEVMPPTAPLRAYAPGDTLFNAGISTGPAGDLGGFHDLLRSSCTVVLFYHADCRYCEEAAPRWSGIRWVDGVPVRWVSLPDDYEEALAFADRFSLAKPIAMITDMASVRALGIYGTPMAIVADADGRFVGGARIFPDSMGSAVDECTLRETPREVRTR